MSDKTFFSARRRPRVLVWALLALLLLAAAFVLVVFGWASDWGRAAPELMWWTVGIFALGMLPFVLMGIVVVSFDRRLRGAMPVVVAGVLVIVGMTVWGMTSTLISESSTAGLIFVFGPFPLLLVVGLATGAAAGFNALRAHRP